MTPTSGYFARFFLALAVAGSLIVFDARVSTLPWLFALAPVAPLMIYHLLYLRPIANRLPPAAIDSVYYLGFLITVSALAAAAIQIAGGQQTDVRPVLEKFAAGMLATGYAVVARLQLQSKAGAEHPADPERALDAYLERSGVLLDNVEMAILRFGSLADTAMAETRKIAISSHALLEQNAANTLKSFDEALRPTLDSIRESVDHIRSMLVDSSFEAEREGFANAIRSSVEVSNDLNRSLGTLARSARDGGESFGRLEAAIASVDGPARMVGARFAELSGEQGALEQSAAHLVSAAAASKQAAEAAQIALAGVVDLANKIASTNPHFDRLASSAHNADTRLESLSSACATLCSSATGVAASLEQLSSALPALSPQVRNLGQDFDGLRASLVSAADSLQVDVERSTRAVGLLAENLIVVTNGIVERTRERQASRR